MGYFLCKDIDLYCYFFTQGWTQGQYGQYYLYDNLLDDQNGLFKGSADSSNLATIALLGGLGSGYSQPAGYYPAYGTPPPAQGRKRRVNCEKDPEECERRRRQVECEDDPEECDRRRRQAECEDDPEECERRRRQVNCENDPEECERRRRQVECENDPEECERRRRQAEC